MKAKKPRQILEMTRREVRYQCYRLRTAADGIRAADEEAEPIKRYFEKQPGFGGWKNFARTWDIGAEGNHNRVTFKIHTEEQEWNLRVAALARPLPGLRRIK